MAHQTLSFARKRWLNTCFFLLFLVFLVAFEGCNGSSNIVPLAEPLFRLSTTLKSPNCDPRPGKPPCKWVIIASVLKVDVVSPSENPFQDCSNCQFSQKIAVVDGNGGLHYLYYKLPKESIIPLSPGDNIKLTYFKGDHSNQGFAVSIVDQNDLLLAAISSGAGGALLAGSLGNFSVTIDSQKEAGREISTCGIKVFRYMAFKTESQSIQLAPGEIGSLKKANGVKYTMGNVNRYNWEASKCTNLRVTPYAFFIHVTF